MVKDNKKEKIDTVKKYINKFTPFKKIQFSNKENI